MADPELGQGSTQISEKYQSLRYLVPSDEEDRFVAAAWSLGTLGLELKDESEGGREYLAYFLESLDPDVMDSIKTGLAFGGSQLVEVKEILPQDWQQEYRARSNPFAVGRHWWVDPREPDGSSGPLPPKGRQTLRIPARTAFGTGSHASTALMVELMEELALGGSRVLDVGTGSGILAMVALASGAESVTALDIEPAAVFIALQTCQLNRLRPCLMAGGLASIRPCKPKETFDLIVANVLPTRLRADYPALTDCLRSTGTLLLSGLLVSQEADLLSVMDSLGLGCQGRLGRGDWVALRLERTRT